jgi:hypothetical protein
MKNVKFARNENIDSGIANTTDAPNVALIAQGMLKESADTSNQTTITMKEARPTSETMEIGICQENVERC